MHLFRAFRLGYQQVFVVDDKSLLRNNEYIDEGIAARKGNPERRSCQQARATGKAEFIHIMGIISVPKSAAQERREKYKAEYWPDEIAWTGEKPEKGWFRAPRTFSLVCALLKTKKVSGKKNPASVYLELLSRHRDTGVVEMASEGEHSYAAGYMTSRGIRTWQEHMKLLEDLGFIKSVSAGNQKYKYVLLIHPSIAVKKLYDKDLVDSKWWDMYRSIQIDMKESKCEDLETNQKPSTGDIPAKAIKRAVKKKTL